MISFLVKPIFFLTPYIFLWSCLNGLIVVGLLKGVKKNRLNTSRSQQLLAGGSTAIASILWNWSIEFNRSTLYLNVDHPYLRISWADALNGVCVFALLSLVLSLWANPQMQASTVTKIAGMAAIVTIFTDTFLF